MSRPKTKLAAGLILASLVLVGQVLSHGTLQSTKPEPGATVRQSPAKIELTFSEALNSGTINLLRTSGSAIPLTLMETDQPDMLVARVEDTLEDGEYSVLWIATSEDDHTISGSYNFAVEISDNDDVLYIIGGIIVGSLLLVSYIFIWRRPSHVDSAMGPEEV